MKNKENILLHIIAFVILMIQAMTLTAREKTAILVIAHGSRSDAWNESVLKMENAISGRLTKKKVAVTARVAFMEMTKPTIAQVTREMEKSGVERVFAAPLFTNPSGHSMYDIPAILGLYFDEELLETLHEEKIEIANTRSSRERIFSENISSRDSTLTEYAG